MRDRRISAALISRGTQGAHVVLVNAGSKLQRPGDGPLLLLRGSVRRSSISLASATAAAAAHRAVDDIGASFSTTTIELGPDALAGINGGVGANGSEPSIKGASARGGAADGANGDGKGGRTIFGPGGGGGVSAPALLGAQSLLLPQGALAAPALLQSPLVAASVAMGYRLRAGALEGALRDCPPAAAAAKCAAAAEVVAGCGGPAAGRPLAHLADLAATGAFHGVPAASHVPAAAGPQYLLWGTVVAQPAPPAGEAERQSGPCPLLQGVDYTAESAALVLALPPRDSWPAEEDEAGGAAGAGGPGAAASSTCAACGGAAGRRISKRTRKREGHGGCAFAACGALYKSREVNWPKAMPLAKSCTGGSRIVCNNWQSMYGISRHLQRSILLCHPLLRPLAGNVANSYQTVQVPVL